MRRHFVPNTNPYRYWLATGATECFGDQSEEKHPSPTLNPDVYENWIPNQPTLIIADYAALCPAEIGKMIRTMKMRADRGEFPFPIRMMLLEREAVKFFEGRSYYIGATEEKWFQVLRGAGLTNQRNTMAAWYGTRAPRRLGPLDDDGIWKVICTFGKERAKQEDRDEILGELRRVDDLCRPLYASMLGDAIGAERAHRQWDRGAIFEHVLRREEDVFWKAAGVTEADKDVLALATMMGPIGTGDGSLPAELKNVVPAEQFSCERYRVMSPKSTDTSLDPLEPDIIGEMFVLEYLNPGNPRRDRITETAWKVAGGKMQSFLLRAVDDFPGHPTLRYLLRKMKATGGHSQTQICLDELSKRGHRELAEEVLHAK